MAGTGLNESNRIDGHDFDSVVALMRHHAQVSADFPALTVPSENHAPPARWTYGELDKRARTFAAHVQQAGWAGERVMILLPSGADYVVAFLGCLYAGAVAVPAYLPANGMHAERIAHIAADCQARGAVVASASALANLRAGSRQRFVENAGCSLVSMEDMTAPCATPWVALPHPAESLAYLQYTSGSTMEPRGVMMANSNLMAYLRSGNRRSGIRPEDVFVTWLPLFHDMGLITGVLQAFLAGASVILISPLSFLQNPLRWLGAVSAYRGTVSVAPNFAYDLCAALPDDEATRALDLSSWAIAGNGAETVQADTLARFARRFAPNGFRAEALNSSYGLAEATLCVTSHPRLARVPVIEVEAQALAQGSLAPPQAGLRSTRLVSCGSAELDSQVLCVDPVTRRPCEDGQVGEIWAAGPALAQGYWGRPQQTQETFRAFLIDGGGPYLRTGDLGAWRQGHLYVVGRLKDVIVVRGQNHHPQDIEYTVGRSHSALIPRQGAAFSIPVGGEERLVIVQEVQRSRRRKMDGAEVVQAIRSAVAEMHGLSVHAVLLLRPASVHVTSSGKIQRQACREAYLNQAFQAIHTWSDGFAGAATEAPHSVAEPSADPPGPAALAAWMTGRIAAMQGIDARQVRSEASFASLGLDSLRLVALTRELAAWLQRPIEPTLLYRYPSIDRAASHLSRADPESDPPPAADIQAAEPVAVVGIACRFPQSNSVEAYWQLLDGAVDAITEIPATRWDTAATFQVGAPAPGKTYSKWAGLVDDVDRFDAHFFGISPREANCMDPQQRIMLETAWHAMEDAGIPPASLAGSDTGVFVGVNTHDYELRSLNDNVAADGFLGTGTHASIIANRVSYFFDLHGPSVTLETACSSSLVALHQARASLLQKESSVAVVGGVNVMLCPETLVVLSQAQMLSPEGRCKAFDAQADGYVRSEGCAVLVLKRYGDAIRDNNRIHGLISGSAVNQDGRSNGLTAPNAQAQEAVIRRALAVAGVTPDAVGYVEAHGTGTGLGDPIEMTAIKAAYGAASERNPTLWVGSVKSNIGHTESVAGLAGLIKVLLAMRHGRIPASLHVRELNPRLALEGSRCAVAVSPQDWPKGPLPRLAGVSSFGFGGTNAHVVVQEPPPPRACAAASDEMSHDVLVLSAKTPASLRQMGVDMVEFLTQPPSPGQPDAPLRALCHTANACRTHGPHRVAVVGQSRDEMAQALRAWLRDEPADNLHLGAGDTPRGTKTAWVFAGQGAQYARMGQALYRHHTVFRYTMDECDRLLQPLLGHSLVDMLYGDEADDHDWRRTPHAQPALFAVEYALAAVWRSSGGRADCLMGHGLGEYVAACLAGVFSLADALLLVAHRGRLMQARTLPGSTQTMLAEFEAVARAVACRAPTLPIVSGATGRLAGPELAEASYWVAQVSEPVAFAQGVRCLAASGCTHAIEVGPRPVLSRFGRHISQQVSWLPSLRRGGDDMRQMLSSLARWHAQGMDVDWAGWARGRLGTGAVLPQPVSLPPYPFEKTRHWHAPSDESTADWHLGARHHPLLGHALEMPEAGTWCHLRRWPLSSPEWASHALPGDAGIPLSLWMATAMAAVHEAVAAAMPEWTMEGDAVSGPRLDRPQAVQVRTLVRSEDGGYRVRWAIRPSDLEASDGHWRERANAFVRPSFTPPPVWPGVPSSQGHLIPQPLERWHALWSAGRPGTPHGSGMEALKELWLSKGEGWARIEMPLSGQEGVQPLQPALLDTCFHLASCLLGACASNPQAMWLPAGFERMTLYRRHMPCKAWIRATRRAPEVCDLDVFNDAGGCVLQVRGLRQVTVPREDFVPTAPVGPEMAYHRLTWLPFERPPRCESRTGRPWVLLCEDPLDLPGLLRLCGRGQAEPVVVTGGKAFHWAWPRATLDWRAESQWQRLFETLQTEGIHPEGLLLHAGSPRAQAVPLVEAVHALAQPAWCAFKQFLSAHAQSNPSLVICTRGAHAPEAAVDDGERMGEAGLAQAVLNGLVRSLTTEYPCAKCLQLDLDPSSDAEGLDDLIELVAGVPGSIQLAVRGERLFQARLQRLRGAGFPARSPALHPHGTYLVTGGLRGIGLATAQWLVSQGTRHLALIGRTMHDEGHQAVAAMRAAGVDVSALLVDVSDAQALERELTTLAARMPPVRGVFHAAGVIDDALLIHSTWPSVRDVMAPKVAGAWNLHRLTQHLALDHFVLYSSAASMTPMKGQSNYAAACAFLDSLACFRRQRGLSGTSVSWGVWSDTGMVARGQLACGLRANGAHGMTTPQGMAALGWMLGANLVHCSASVVDEARLKAALCPGTPYALLSDFGCAAPPAQTEQEEPSTALAWHGGLEPEEAKRRLLNHLLQRITQVLHLNPKQRQDLENGVGEQSLSELGFDSLMAFELRDRIRADLGVDIPLQGFFDGSTVAGMASAIHLQLMTAGLASMPSASDVDFDEFVV